VKCKKEYLRYFDVTKSEDNFREHITGRKCGDQECEGDLKDTIVHFGENLPENEYEKAMDNSKKSTFSLVIGTSMKVAPANKLPILCRKNKGSKFVIVNLQKTIYDKYSDLKVYSKSDLFFQFLMNELDLNDFDQDYDANKEFN
jgi:NAD-dependent SIR2 family protein deacetylase